MDLGVLLTEFVKVYGLPGLVVLGMFLMLRQQIAESRTESAAATEAVKISNQAQEALRQELQTSRDEARDQNKQKEQELSRLRTEMNQLQQRENSSQLERNRMREQMDKREKEIAAKFTALNGRIK